MEVGGGRGTEERGGERGLMEEGEGGEGRKRGLIEGGGEEWRVRDNFNEDRLGVCREAWLGKRLKKSFFLFPP